MKPFFLFLNVLLICCIFTLQTKGQSPELLRKLDKIPIFSPTKTGLVVYDQITHPSTATIISSNFTDEGNLQFSSFSADDFVVPNGESWNVAYVSVLGYNSVDPLLSVESINLYFYEDNGGMPGNALFSFENISSFNELPSSLENVNLLEITLPNTISFDEGTYWICAQANCDYIKDGQWNWIFYDTPATIGNEFHWKNPADGFGYGYTDWTTGSMVAWFPPYDLAFALYGESFNLDVAAVELLEPQTGEGLTSNEAVTVKIKNEGLNEVTGFEISYSINGGSVVNETVTGISIQTNAFFEYTFSTLANLSTPGSYTLDIAVSIEGDENPANNQLSLTIFNLGTIYPLENGNTAQTITVCSGTFTDPGGLYSPFEDNDFGTCTIYPATAGSMTRLNFLQFDAGWADFAIYNGEDTNAPLIGMYDPNTGSPGIVTAVNPSGALTIAFQGSGWDHGEGWAAYISCYMPAEDDLAVIDLTSDLPAIFEHMDVTLIASIHNIGTLPQTKDVTFTANGMTIGTTTTGLLQPYDTTSVSIIWTPTLAGTYTVEASVPTDLGSDNNNTMGFERIVHLEGSLFESFEGQEFPPEFWTCKSFGKSEGYAYDGNFSAQIYVPLDFPSGDTLITPQLHIEAGDQLTFATKGSLWWPGKLSMYWKNSETGIWNLLEEIELNQMQWELHTIDISSAAGNNYIGFHAWFNDPNSWGGQTSIDFITGIGPELYFVDHDLIAKKVNGDIVINQNQSVNYDILIKNIGAMDVAAGSYTVKLMKETETGPVELGTLSGVDIESMDAITYSFDVAFTDIENTAIFADIIYAEDLNTGNNRTFPLDIFVKPEGTMHPIIGTENNVQWTYPISSGQYLLTQSIYFNNELQTHGIVNGISLYYNNIGLTDLNDYPIQLWLVENDSTDVAGEWIPSTGMSLVFDGVLDFRRGYNEVHIPFDNDFIYSGKNCEIMIKTLSNANIPTIGFNSSTSTEVRTRNTNDWAIPVNDEDPSSYYTNEFAEYLNAKFTILPVDFGSISGTVYDELANPIEGAVIIHESYAGNKTTNQDGEYAYGYIPEGANNLTSVVFGYEDNVQSVNVIASQYSVLDFIMIPKPLITITGKVVGDNDPATGLENVEISVEGYTGYSMTTDVNGDFQIQDIYGNETYTITILHSDYVIYEQVLDITDQNIDLGTITLTEILKVPFNIKAVGNATELNLTWENPQTGLFEVLAYDDSIHDNGYSAEIGETVSIGNFMPVDGPVTVTDFDLYFAKYVNGLSIPVTLEIYDINQTLLFESEEFMTGIDEWVNVDIPNLSLEDDFYAMVKWYAPAEQSSYFGVSMYGGAPNYAYVAYPSESFGLLSELIGNDACMLIHANMIVLEPVKSKSVTEYTIYRGLLSDVYNFGSWSPIANVSEESYTENEWLPSEPGDYVYAVEANYFGGKSISTFSNILNLTIVEPLNLSATVNDNDATLNWDAPQSDYVESYNIYLNDMNTPVANTSELSFTIENLSIAAYTVGISAVYAFGESEIVTVDFNILTSAVEDIKPVIIYPNPATQYLYISNAEKEHVEIYNGLGISVMNLRADSNHFRIDVADLASGAYTLIIHSKNEVNAFKLFIVR